MRTELVWIYNCLIFYYRAIAYGDNVLNPYSAVARVGLDPGLVGIPAGTFTMGSPDSEPVFLEEERPQTEVKLTRAFWMSRYETTQEEYFLVMGTYSSRFTTRDYKYQPIDVDLSRPVERVSWQNAANYCAVLTDLERKAGRFLRAVFTGCPRRRNGSMRAGRGRRHGSAMGMIPTTQACGITSGIGITAATKPIEWGRRNCPIRGACMTCRGTYRSGARTGMAPILAEAWLT
jgi:hypothetical protein